MFLKRNSHQRTTAESLNVGRDEVCGPRSPMYPVDAIRTLEMSTKYKPFQRPDFRTTLIGDINKANERMHCRTSQSMNVRTPNGTNNFGHSRGSVTDRK